MCALKRSNCSHTRVKLFWPLASHETYAAGSGAPPSRGCLPASGRHDSPCPRGLQKPFIMGVMCEHTFRAVSLKPFIMDVMCVNTHSRSGYRLLSTVSPWAWLGASPLASSLVVWSGVTVGRASPWVVIQSVALTPSSLWP